MARKKYRLEILTPARDEILAIAHLHLELVGPAAARKITARLKESLEHLCSHPLMGRAMRDKDLCERGYRALICGPYLCIYRFIGDTVFVYHVADGRTDYPQHMKDLEP